METKWASQADHFFKYKSFRKNTKKCPNLHLPSTAIITRLNWNKHYVRTPYQESTSVGCVPPAFLGPPGGWGLAQPLAVGRAPDADHLGCIPPLGHETCDACWEANLPCEQTDRCKNITFSQLHLRAVKMTWYAKFLIPISGIVTLCELSM